MDKKKLAGIIIVVIILAFSFFNLFKNKTQDIEDFEINPNEIVNRLRGEIVYVKRDGNFFNVYTISANGNNEKFLYHNVDAINSNCLCPEWSENGSRIYFTAMRGGRWKAFSMNIDGGDVILEQKEPCLGDVGPKDKDILWERGSLFRVDDKGERTIIYYHKNFNSNFNVGANSAAWSPDKNFIIFELNGFIFIADKDGRSMKEIIMGSYPNWKY